MIAMGRKIAEGRRRRGLTQDQLAEQLGVSFQAVSSWERGENEPDRVHLVQLARALDMSTDDLLSCVDKSGLSAPRTRIFSEEHMYTFLKGKAADFGLKQTAAALPFAREQHKGQLRDGIGERVPYINHPLVLACHAWALGLRDDDVLAALLLHDTVEDTGVKPDELPAGPRVQQAVCLLSRNMYYQATGDGAKDRSLRKETQDKYYAGIAEDPLACLVKCVDRCGNLSDMAFGFSRQGMANYIRDTEEHVLPLLQKVKDVPEWNDAAWLISYQLTALIEAYKRLL